MLLLFCIFSTSFLTPTREVAVFDSSYSLIHSFSNPGFLFPCSIAFCEERQEAYVLGGRKGQERGAGAVEGGQESLYILQTSDNR